MAEEFLSGLENLTGKNAVVTGGSQGIGLQTTVLLASLGATVYVCTLDIPENHAGIESARKELGRYQADYTGSIHFHELDLSEIKSAKRSAEKLKEVIGEADGRRLDIVIGNAGIAFAPLNKLSSDGYERAFAVNCLGHFVFIMSLLDLIEETAGRYGEARITLTSSEGYKAAKKLDYTALTTIVPNDGTSLLQLGGGFQRYLNSKLAVLYFALELDKRIWRKTGGTVFVNACQPGRVPTTGLGNNQQPLVGPWLQSSIKTFLGIFLRNSTLDAAKTQVYLSASKQTSEEEVHGQYWSPKLSWMQYYLGSQKEELVTALAKDESEWRRLWEFCEEASSKALQDRT